MEQHTEQPHHKNLWLRTLLASLVSLYFIGLYLVFEGASYSLRLINKASAWNAVLLIGLSLALSGICYFWNAFDAKIIYRKYLGIIGFGYACIHTVTTLMQISAKFDLIHFFLAPKNVMSFSAALVAFILLAFLTVISHSKAIEYFGGVNWKLLMRFAYIAFISLTIHFFLKTYDVILQWVHSKSFIPPLAGTMFIFASLVVTIRLLVLLDSRLKKTNSKSQIPSKPETSST